MASSAAAKVRDQLWRGLVHLPTLKRMPGPGSHSCTHSEKNVDSENKAAKTKVKVLIGDVRASKVDAGCQFDDLKQE